MPKDKFNNKSIYLNMTEALKTVQAEISNIEAYII